MDAGLKRLMPLYEEYCNINKNELSKIIEELILVGNPNITIPGEIKDAICRYNLQ